MTVKQLQSLTVSDLKAIAKEYGDVLSGMLHVAPLNEAPTPQTEPRLAPNGAPVVRLIQPGNELTKEQREHLESERSIRAARRAQDALKAGSQSPPSLGPGDA